MYHPRDLAGFLCRSLQPVMLAEELEGVVIRIEVTKINYIDLLITLGKLQPYYGIKKPSIFLKGTLSEWLDFFYHSGNRTSINVVGDIMMLQLLREGVQKSIQYFSRAQDQTFIKFLGSFLELLRQQIGIDAIMKDIWISSTELDDNQKKLFDIYYQLERVEQKIANFLR